MSLECKTLSKQIRNVNDSKWEEVAGNICYPGIKAKFYQNPYAMDCLIRKTGGKRIVECATDCLWATGVPLSDPTSLDETKWISQGILGQMLESIRNEQLIGHDSATGYHQQPAITSNTSLLPPSEANIAQSIHRVITSALQPIPGASHDCHSIPMDGSSSVTDSASASASTTPVSDTTVTDTDPGEGATGPPQDPNQDTDTSNVIP